MAENIIIAGEKKKTDEEKADRICVSVERGDTVAVICDNPEELSRIVGTDTRIYKGNIWFPELMEKAKVPAERTTALISDYLSWEERHPLGNLEYLVLSMMVETAYKSGDFYTGMNRQNFNEILKCCRGKADAVSEERKEARSIYEKIRGRLAEMGFLDEYESIGMPEAGKVTFIQSKYPFLCSLYLECLYRTIKNRTVLFVPGYVRQQMETLETAKERGISTIITVSSIDFLTMFYPGRFAGLFTPADEIILCGEQMLRRRTAGLLARMGSDVENEGLVAENILNLKQNGVCRIKRGKEISFRVKEN